jgi:hypothetical protein
LDLIVGDVGQGIDGQLGQGINPHGYQCQREQADNELVLDAQVNDLV